jgi:hypothetical protein
MITVNYNLSLRLKGRNKKKSQHKNCQGLRLDLRENQHKKIRDAIRAKHPSGWILEDYAIVYNIVEDVKQTKTVTIMDKDSHGKDEAYGEWFTCYKCSEYLIAPEFSYCPGCGRKIVWKLTK